MPGRLIVRRRAGVEENRIEGALRMQRAAARRHLPALGISVIDVPEAGSEATKQSLEASGLFESVERDYYAHTAAVPNDPWFRDQWHLSKIQAPAAWEQTTGAPAVMVAVIDSGIDAGHPDLASNLAPGWSFWKGSGDTSDTLGHGTAVAGTVAAASNNGLGVAGVSWGSRIMPLAVVDPNDFAAYSSIAAAVQYAADHGARVINISIGGSGPSSFLQSAIDYAWSKGAVIFASAMNKSTSTPYYPAACKHVIAVAATDSADLRAGFSNYGNWIGLSAPGSGILTTMAGGGYGYWYGTSFSSPIAAGIAALMLAANPWLTNAELVAMIEQTADDLGAPGFDPVFGWGRANADRAVAAAVAALSSTTEPVEAAPRGVTRRARERQQFTRQ